MFDGQTPGERSATDIMTSAASLTLQVGSLYASGATSTFTGTGGPFGYSPFTSQFGGVITSAGLANEPFADTVYNVAAGDEVIFVLAVQNLGGSRASGVTLKATLPTGFALLSSGLNLTVIDGTGTDLATTGDLFSSGGLQVGVPIAAYDANSGLNVTLVTYSLVATQALPGPNTDIPASAAITGYVDGGGNATSLPPAVHTDVVSAAPTPVVTAETDPTAVAKGATIAFDVSLTLPAGTIPNLIVAPVLPSGTAMLDFVSATVLSLGSGLTLGTPSVSSDGSVHFGTVQSSGTATAAGDTLTVRFVVRADGTASGPATFDTTVSATDPNSPGGVWAVTVPSTVGVVLPPPPPLLSGLSSNWSITTVTADHPFAGLVITPAPDQALSGTIAITATLPYLGTLSTLGPGTLNSGKSTFTYSGTLADIQAAARQIQFAGALTGTETFTITVVDSAGGVAQDATTAVSINQPNSPDPLFDTAFYLAHNPDVAAAGVDPLQHFLQFGWKEGRNPDAFFDVTYYLKQNPDVAAAAVDPLLHYQQFGYMEGRQPSLIFPTRRICRPIPMLQQQVSTR